MGHRTPGRDAKRETGRQKEDTRSILPRPMRRHRQTRGERVACTLKVATGSVLTPVAAPVPVPPDIDFGASEAHHGHDLFRILPFRGPVGDTLEAWQAERAGRV